MYSDEINANKLMLSVCDLLNPNLVCTLFFIKAMSLAMARYPMLNSTINAKHMMIRYHGEHNVGVVMDT